MKKIISLLLCVLMISACFVISTGASETLTLTGSNSYSIPEGYSPVAITHVSNTTVYNSSGGTKNWSGWWGLLESSLDGSQEALNIASYNGSDTKLEVIGTFNPTKLEKFVIYINSKWLGRANKITVSLSKDNETYDEIGVISASHLSSGPSYGTCDIPEAYRDTEYRYVKLTKNATGWVGFNSFVLLAKTENIKAAKTYPENAELQTATYVDGYCDNAAKIWDLNNSTTVADKASTMAYSTAKFENPVVISKIEFLTGENGTRARGGAVYGSADGKNWDKLVTMPSTMTDDTTYTLSVIANKAYTYIKVASQESWPYNWSAVQCRVYGYAETDDRAEVLSYTSTPAGEEANIWSDTNTTVHKGEDGDGITEYSIARLKYPTVVTDIYFSHVTASGRNRQIKFYGSVDGETWTELAGMKNHKNDNVYNNSTEHFTVANDTAFNYVKVDNSSMGDWYWSVVNVAVYGKPAYNAAVYAGVQTKVDVDNGVYYVRFLATVDELALENRCVGFVITASYGDGGEQSLDLTTSTAYGKVTAAGVEYSATDLFGGEGHEYICAVVLRKISIEKYDDITFTVQTYVKDADGEKVMGGVYTLVINDGAEVK